jgi:hypothetical protein
MIAKRLRPKVLAPKQRRLVYCDFFIPSVSLQDADSWLAEVRPGLSDNLTR